jgi:tRNA threonylcarbamoyladenosine biosynthesis protein TsaE
MVGMTKISGVSRSTEHTYQIGKRLALLLPPNSVVCFFGDLGAGKTSLIKGITAEAAHCSIEEVSSPTFTYLNIYNGAIPVFHFDLYRIRNENEFLSMGFDEYLTAGGICCIEWSERIPALLTDEYKRIVLSHVEEDCRQIEVYGISGADEKLFI